MPLLLSLLALGLGPCIAVLAGRTSRAAEFFDGLVLVALCGLVLLHILPHTVAVAGWVALAAAAVGFAFPFAVERVGHRSGVATHRVLVPLVMASFGVHAFVDGAALVEHDAEAHQHLLALAIVLHRLPDGLAIWSVVRPSRGGKVAAIVLGVLALFTVFGFAAGASVLEGTSGVWIALLQAFVAGSVLHVILHRPHAASDHDHDHDHDHAHAHAHAHDHDHHSHGTACPPSHHHHVAGGVPAFGALASTAGALVGLALLIVVTRTHPIVSRETGELAAGDTFRTLALEAAPALLLAIALSGLVHALMPHSFRAWLSRGGALSQAARGIVAAPFLPSCSCGAVPLYRSLVAKGTPVASAVALLVAAPDLGFSAVLLSLTMLGHAVTIARVAAAVATALLAAALLGLVADAPQPSRLISSAPPPPDGPLRQRLLTGMAVGVSDVLDHTGPWMLLGLAMGALFEPLARADSVALVPPLLQVPAFALAAMPLFVCASGATPLIAVLIHKGLSSGAAIAFLVTGPASNVTTLGVLAQLHGRRIAAIYLLIVTLAAVSLGYATNAALPQSLGPALHSEAEHDAASWVNVACLAGIVLLALQSLLRHGPRHWLEQVLPLGRHAPNGAKAR
jgi:uncharacterized membrane protein YraQ (UPF0718 family)